MRISTLSTSQKIAHIISVVTVPPTFSFLAFTLLTSHFEQGNALHKFSVAFVAITFSSILPILYILYLRKQKTVSSYDVPLREQRTNPYLMSVLNNSIGFFLLLFMHASLYVWTLMWCYAINTFILFWINKYWKISAHTMGIAGPMIMLSVLFGWNVLFFLPLLFLVGWARIELRVHSIAQVVAGSVAGAVLTIAQIFFVFQIGRELVRNFLQ